MGDEAHATLTHRGETAEGKALLETDELIFRGDSVRVRIPFSTIRRVESADGALRLTTEDGVAVLKLGPRAERWADKIRHPKGLIDKLGVREDSVVVVLGVDDAGFLRELGDRLGKAPSRRLRKDCDVIFFAANRLADLARLAELRDYLGDAGAIWVVHRKGPEGVKDTEIFDAGRAAKLTSTKVVRFSPTHSAEKLVIPVALRKGRAKK